MSSSDKFADWNLFTEREIPEELHILSPAAEISGDLQRFHEKLNEAKRATEIASEELLEPLAQQAVFVFKLSQALDMYQSDLEQLARPKTDIYRHFRIIRDQMQELLTDSGLEIIVPLGEAFEAVADFVDVQHWRHDEAYSTETVAEVLEPIIKYRGRVIKLGRVVMGASPDQETER